MAEREAIYKLKFMVDKAQQQQSVGAIDALAKEFADVDKNAQQVSRSAQNAVAKLTAFGQARTELHQTAEEAKDAAIATDDFASALEHAANTADHMERVKKEVRQAREEIEQAAVSTRDFERRLDAADENFDVVSRRVGLAGDVQSNLGATRGLADVAGLGKTGQAIGVAGELAALTEELPRLKAALSNMPDVLKFVHSQIGTAGVGLIGALAALGAVIAVAAKQTREQQAAQDAKFEADKKVAEFLRSASPQEAIDRQRELAKTIEEQSARLSELNTKYKAGTEGVKQALPVIGALAVFASENSLPGAQGQIGSFNKEIEKSTTELQKNQEEYRLLSQELEDSGTQAQLAAQAEQRLREARQQSETEFVAALEGRNRRIIEAEKLIATGTQEQVQERINAITQEREVIERTIADLEEFTGRTLDQLLDDTSLDPTTIKMLQGYVNQLRALDEEQGILAKSTADLAGSHKNLNSALEHQQKLLAERVAQIKEQAQAELEFTRFLKSATSETVASRIESLQEEATALRSMLPELERLAPTSEAAANELQNTTDRLAEIDAELQRLGSEGILAAIQREQAELTAEIEKIEAARDEKIAQIRAQSTQKEIDLYEDLQRDLADAIADAQEERADAQREYQQEAVDIEEELAKKRLEIERKFAKSQAQAVGDRDVLAAYQAKEARDEELRDAEESAAEQRQELEENYQEQLATIDRELEKQRQTLNAKYLQQLNDLRLQTQQSIALEQQKAQQEISTRQQAYQQELALLNSFTVGGVSSIGQFANESLTTLTAFVGQARQILTGLTNPPVPATTGPISTSTNVPRPPGSGGGPQPYPGITAGGININIAGYTIPTIQEQIYKVLSAMIPS